MRGLIGALAATLGLVMAAPCSAAALKGDCPDGYVAKAGLNTDFPSDGVKRAFIVFPPQGAAGPAPVFVPLTGSVESTMDNLTVPRSGATSLLAAKGFLVIGPVRECANQDPNLRAGVCNGPGHDGWNWNPWHEGRGAGPAGDAFKIDEGSDSRFLIAAVKCAAKSFPVDAKRIYLGGISSGGTMTNRALTFRSDFWAGGLPISGEWYVTKDDGSALSFNDARAYVASDPHKVFQGRVGPYPLRTRLSPMIVISVWGGEKDMWDCGPPLGLCSDYRPTTQAGSNYFSSMTNVVHIACSAHHGHMWPQANTQAFNAWALKTLASHPKGSDPKTFKLTPPPEGYSCKLGRFTDHYPEG
jgi:poly(3-hydroxybutyrate) depolymerase